MSRRAPPPSDPEQGVYRGRAVARRFVSADGFTVLVGKTAADNDDLSLHLGEPQDFWLHIASGSGSHVVVRNPERLERLPKATLEYAAGLAAYFSKARAGGRVAVHLARCADVSKGRGFEAGKVELRRHATVMARPAS